MRWLSLVPNQITLLRLLLIGVLWYLALQDLSFPFVILFFITGALDFVDGFAARHLHQETTFGAKFDSLVDMIFYFCAPFWLAVLLPDFFAYYTIPLVVLVLLYGLNKLIGYIKFRELTAYHLISGKIAGAFVVTFLSVLLAIGDVPYLFWTTFLVVVLSQIEEFLITVTSERMRPNQISFFRKHL